MAIPAKSLPENWRPICFLSSLYCFPTSFLVVLRSLPLFFCYSPSLFSNHSFSPSSRFLLRFILNSPIFPPNPIKLPLFSTSILPLVHCFSPFSLVLHAYVYMGVCRCVCDFSGEVCKFLWVSPMWCESVYINLCVLLWCVVCVSISVWVYSSVNNGDGGVCIFCIAVCVCVEGDVCGYTCVYSVKAEGCPKAWKGTWVWGVTGELSKLVRIDNYFVENLLFYF